MKTPAPDDTVIYTLAHRDWLAAAMAWPSREESKAWYERRTKRTNGLTPVSTILRQSVRGRVVETGEGWVRVLWENDRGETCHFPDNLEVV